MRRSGNPQDPYLAWGGALAVVLFVLYVYPGVLSPVTSHFDGACQTIPLAASAEDIRIDPATGFAYLSYLDRSPQKNGQKNGKRATGTVMLLDLNAATPHVRAALTTEPADFRPAGLSLYAPAEGPKRLFVVNRNSLRHHSIEIFEQTSTGAFAPVESLKDRGLWSPNSIVAVGPRQFYVTNDSGFKERDAADPLRQTERRLKDRRSNVLFFDGTRWHVVAEDLNRANGIAVTPDGRTVYVSESSGRRLQVFDRDLKTGSLKPRERVSVDSVPDNLTVAANGVVWIGSHPRALAILRALHDPGSRAPTQVLKFDPAAPKSQRVHEVYVNDGTEIAAGTVAAPRDDRFLIGSLTDHKLLLCKPGARPVITGPEKET